MGGGSIYGTIQEPREERRLRKIKGMKIDISGRISQRLENQREIGLKHSVRNRIKKGSLRNNVTDGRRNYSKNERNSFL